MSTVVTSTLALGTANLVFQRRPKRKVEATRLMNNDRAPTSYQRVWLYQSSRQSCYWSTLRRLIPTSSMRARTFSRFLPSSRPSIDRGCLYSSYITSPVAISSANLTCNSFCDHRSCRPDTKDLVRTCEPHQIFRTLYPMHTHAKRRMHLR